jgi:glycosyltransferase involved in cell wall biosynthesis
LRSISDVRVIHVDFIDVLLIVRIYLAFHWKKVRLYYDVGDLSESERVLLNRIVQTPERLLLKRIDILIYSSPFFWDEYYRNIYSGNRLLIENMPERSILGSIASRQNAESMVIGFIGSLRYRVTLDRLIRVVSGLRNEGYKVRIFLAGSGPDYTYIEDKVKDMDFIDFYGPYDYTKEIASLYEKIDIAFSVYDTRIKNVRYALPNRLYESIVCRKPLIVAKETRLSGYVQKLGVGYSVAYDSDEEYREAILDILKNGVRYQTILKNLQLINRNNFFYDKYYTILDQLYNLRDNR